MKKILCVLLCPILIILFSGCNKKSSAVTAVTSGLKFTAEINYLDETYEYTTTILKNCNAQLEALENGKPSGLKLEFSGDNVTLSFNDLEYKATLSALAEGTILDFIYSVFKDADKNKPSAFSKDDEFFIEGETNKYKYKIILGETGLPIKIEEQNSGITALIKNVSLL